MEKLWPTPSYDRTSTKDENSFNFVTTFYRILMPSVVRQHKLVLPKKFVDEYGEELSRTVILKLPAGDIWPIRLRKSGSLLWLEDGFDKFMKHFSVGFGYFLLFKYKGNSEFYLHIFDFKAIEIDYDALEFDSKRSSGECLQTDHVRNMKNENDESPPPRKKQKPILRRHPKSESRKQFELDPSNSDNVIEKKPYMNGNLRCSFESRLEREATRRNQVQERAKALDEAEMYKPDNPFCIVQLRSNVQYQLHLPTRFCKENKSYYMEFFELRNSDDRTWRVHCCKDGFRWTIGKGWSSFFKDKMLGEGDVCVFEMLNKGIFKVSIFYAK